MLPGSSRSRLPVPAHLSAPALPPVLCPCSRYLPAYLSMQQIRKRVWTKPNSLRCNRSTLCPIRLDTAAHRSRKLGQESERTVSADHAALDRPQRCSRVRHEPESAPIGRANRGGKIISGRGRDREPLQRQAPCDGSSPPGGFEGCSPRGFSLAAEMVRGYYSAPKSLRRKRSAVDSL